MMADDYRTPGITGAPLDWVPTRTPIEQVAWPDIAPTKANRTAAIWNNALPKTDPWYGLHLWLTKVSTGWNLSGSEGQSRNNRIFYPRNISQQPITIEGQMPNQHQYDRLVYFIKKSHETALNQPGNVQKHLTFALPNGMITLPGHSTKPYTKDGSGRLNEAYWDGTKVVRRYYREMYVDGYITGIRAGHPRWNFAPRFQMTFLVVKDHIWDTAATATNDLRKLLQDSADTYSQTNDQITQNYRKVLRITPGSIQTPKADDGRGGEALGPVLDAADGFPQWNPPPG